MSCRRLHFYSSVSVQRTVIRFFPPIVQVNSVRSQSPPVISALQINVKLLKCVRYGQFAKFIHGRDQIHTELRVHERRIFVFI